MGSPPGGEGAGGIDTSSWGAECWAWMQGRAQGEVSLQSILMASIFKVIPE